MMSSTLGHLDYLRNARNLQGGQLNICFLVSIANLGGTEIKILSLGNFKNALRG